MHRDCLFGANFNFAPFAVAIVAADVVVGLSVAKSYVGPINVFHKSNFMFFLKKSTKIRNFNNRLNLLAIELLNGILVATPFPSTKFVAQ